MNLKMALCLLAPALLLANPLSAATMHYDCSKAGNANKTACKKAAAPAPKAVAAKPAKVGKTAAVAAAKPAPKRVAAKPAAQVASADSKDPKGASARCKDGMYSHSKAHAGACSRHGGVASWL